MANASRKRSIMYDSIGDWKRAAVAISRLTLFEAIAVVPVRRFLKG